MNPVLLLVVSILAIILLSSRFRLHTFAVLFLLAVAVGLLAGLPAADVLKHLRAGFGHTLEKIGLLVILGTVLGSLLDHSRATQSLATAILRRIGTDRTPLAVLLMAFLVGLPIFCDSGFIVLSGLVLSLAARLAPDAAGQEQARATHLQLVLCLAGGLYAVHCLVPPHPGITAAVGILGVDTGRMILLGTVLAIPGTAFAYGWARFAGKRFGPSMQDPAGQPLVPTPDPETASTNLPSATGALLAILVPIGLIALKSLLSLSPDRFPALVLAVAGFLGDPIAALCVGVVLALGLVRPLNKTVFNQVIEESIVKAGPVLAIVGAGGAFGEIIQHLGLEQSLSAFAGKSGLGLLVPFGLAVLLKTAQGSSTVAVLSVASLVKPLLPALGLATAWDQELALAAMGAGSMTLSHANDAYFWVISRFGRVDAPTLFRSYSLLSVGMGLSTFILIWLLPLWV